MDRKFQPRIKQITNDILFTHMTYVEACLFADPGLTRAKPEELEKLSGRLVAMAKKHYKDHGIWPHPAQAYGALTREQGEEGAVSRGRKRKQEEMQN